MDEELEKSNEAIIKSEYITATETEENNSHLPPIADIRQLMRHGADLSAPPSRWHHHRCGAVHTAPRGVPK